MNHNEATLLQPEVKNQRAFITKISLCLSLLGAEADLVAAVSSWQDTMEDEDILSSIDTWIEATIEEKSRVLSTVKRLHNKS
jgi:hypothetical protein